MRLQYKAATKEGKIELGIIDANDINEAATYLRSKQLMPIHIVKEQEDMLARALPMFHKVKTSDMVIFTRQLSSMLSSGLTLMKALGILKDQIQNQAMAEVVNSVINDIEEGKTFSSAISKYPKVFSPIYVSLIKAGESSGLLDKVLLRLADNLEKQSKLRSTIKSALMYPVIVVILMGAVMFIMIVFVMPQLTGLYQNLNVPLPLPTQILLWVTAFMTTFWPIMIIAIVGGIALFRRWRKTVEGTLIWDSIMLKLPIFGKLIQESILAEFTRTFGLLVGTGVLVVDSLLQTADTAGNIHYKNAIVDVSKQVEKGVTIGDAMSVYPLFPPILIQLVKVGEQTGKVDDSLARASDYFEGQLDGTVKTLTTAMEPFIMIVLGIGVAFLIISVITPIYSLISSIQ